MKQKAFTLIELLVVIGIIGILSAIGIVSFGAVREKARRGACIATLRSNFNSDENLVAYWNFDEGAGTTAKDFWGNNGTINGAGNAYVSDSIIDTALNLDLPHYITVSDSQALSPSNAVSIEVWVKTAWAGAGHIIRKYDASPFPGFSLYKDTIIDFRFWAGGSGGGGWLFCNRNIADGNWHYLVGTAEKGGGKKNLL